MKRSDAIPARWQVVAAAVLNPDVCPVCDTGWRVVDDALVAARTGYSERSLRWVWQEIADQAGGGEIGRAVGGVRLVRPGGHKMWVRAAADVQVSV